MPTKKPRLMLSASAELLHDLSILAYASRKPVATVAVELLTDMRAQMRSLAREIAGITIDRQRAAEIERRISESPEAQQHGFRFTERVNVVGVRLPAKKPRKRGAGKK